MRDRTLVLGAMSAVVRRDFRVLLSYRTPVVTLFFGPIISVMLFYYVSRLVEVESLGASDGYFAYVIVGLAALGVLHAAVDQGASMLRQELMAGTFERMAASALGPAKGCVALAIFPVLRAIVVATVTIVFATVAFHLDLEWPRALLAIPASVLVALAFAPVGLLAVALMFIARQAHSLVSSILMLFSVVAGVYFPVTLLPGWVSWTSDVQPFTPAVGLMRELLATSAVEGSIAQDAFKLAAFAAVLFPVSLFALTRALRFSQLRGTITEY